MDKREGEYVRYLQLMNKAFGGKVSPEKMREDGQTEIWVDANSCLFQSLDPTQTVLLTHGDSVTREPYTVAHGFQVTAHSDNLVAGTYSQLLLYRTRLYRSSHIPDREFQSRRNTSQYVLCSLIFGYTGLQILVPTSPV